MVRTVSPTALEEEQFGSEADLQVRHKSWATDTKRTPVARPVLNTIGICLEADSYPSVRGREKIKLRIARAAAAAAASEDLLLG